MSDKIYESAGFDYTEYINNEEDYAIFLQLKELEKYLEKPLNECFKEVIEYSRLDRELRKLPPLKIIIQNSKMN